MNQQLMQLISAMKGGQNPQNLMLNFLQQNMGNSPIGQNLLRMAQNNDGKGIEQFARNLCAQRGLDFDKEFSNFRKQFGL